MNVIYDSADFGVTYYIIAVLWLDSWIEDTHSVLLMTVWTSCIMLCSENR